MPRHYLPLVAALALLAACTPPASSQAKRDRVDRLATALSVSDNAGLAQAAANLGQVGQTLSAGGFKKAGAAVGNIVAQGGGNVVSTNSGNVVSTNSGNIVAQGAGNIVAQGAGNLTAGAPGTSLVARTTTAVLQALAASAAATGYHLNQADDVRIEADPTTGELARIWNSNASLGFKYTPSGNAHHLAITLDGMPDHTTGNLDLGLSATRWHSVAPPPDADFSGYGDAPSGDTTPSGDPGTAYDPNSGTPTLPTYPGSSYPAGYPASYPGSTPSYPLVPGFHLAQASHITLMGDEVPDDPQSIVLGLGLVPKGDFTQQMKLDVTADDVQTINGKPEVTHVGLNASIPTLRFSCEMHTSDLIRLAMTGTLDVTPPGKPGDTFTYVFDYDQSKQNGTLDLTDTAAQIRLHLVTAAPTSPGGQPATQASLYATDDNSKIGDVTPSPGEPGVLLVKYPDGSTRRWALFGAGAGAGAPPSLPPSAPAATTPVGTSATPTPAPQPSIPRF